MPPFDSATRLSCVPSSGPSAPPSEVMVSTTCLRAKQLKYTPYPLPTMPSPITNHRQFHTHKQTSSSINLDSGSTEDSIERNHLAFIVSSRQYHASLTHQTAFGRNLTACSLCGSLTHNKHSSRCLQTSETPLYLHPSPKHRSLNEEQFHHHRRRNRR